MKESKEKRDLYPNKKGTADAGKIPEYIVPELAEAYREDETRGMGYACPGIP